MLGRSCLLARRRVTSKIKRMSSAIESAIEPLLHSPLLCEIAETLQSRVRDEAERRRKFYRELRDDQKAEFVDGQVILHSPARDKHIAVRQNLERLLGTHVSLQEVGKVRTEKGSTRSSFCSPMSPLCSPPSRRYTSSTLVPAH